MAFGPIMRFTAKDDLQVELAPFAKEDLVAFVSPGMQQMSITRYMSHHAAPVLEDEQEWYEKVRANKNECTWGIWVIEKGARKLIGTSSLGDIERKHILQATSGSMIFDTSYWGKGIASSGHKARTWYAFQQMGMMRIKSAVIHGNVGSRTALERSGYFLHSVERNVEFIDGQLRHMDNLECLNPADWVWRQWWGGDRPTKLARAARTRTQAAIDWAETNVTLP